MQSTNAGNAVCRCSIALSLRVINAERLSNLPNWKCKYETNIRLFERDWKYVFFKDTVSFEPFHINHLPSYDKFRRKNKGTICQEVDISIGNSLPIRLQDIFYCRTLKCTILAEKGVRNEDDLIDQESI